MDETLRCRMLEGPFHGHVEIKPFDTQLIVFDATAFFPLRDGTKQWAVYERTKAVSEGFTVFHFQGLQERNKNV